MSQKIEDSHFKAVACSHIADLASSIITPPSPRRFSTTATPSTMIEGQMTAVDLLPSLVSAAAALSAALPNELIDKVLAAPAWTAPSRLAVSLLTALLEMPLKDHKIHTLWQHTIGLVKAGAAKGGTADGAETVPIFEGTDYVALVKAMLAYAERTQDIKWVHAVRLTITFVRTLELIDSAALPSCRSPPPNSRPCCILSNSRPPTLPGLLV